MKKYKVIVDGQEYEVGIEALDTAPLAAAPQKPAAPAAAAPATGGEAVNSPMPGTILAVNVQEGTAVKKGQALMILEAMKMENEVTAPVSGVVGNVQVANGATINTGDLMLVIE